MFGAWQVRRQFPLLPYAAATNELGINSQTNCYSEVTQLLQSDGFYCHRKCKMLEKAIKKQNIPSIKIII